MGATDFTPIRGAMWEGETAMACKGDAVALWLMAFLPTHFAGHSSGVFRFQRDFVAFRYGFTDAQLLEALDKLQSTGFVLYDRRTDWVFVTRLAEIRHPGGFRTPGKRQADMATYFRKHLAACPSPVVMDAFMARYGETHAPARPHLASSVLAPSRSASLGLAPSHSASLRLSETENADPRLSEINKTRYSLNEAPRVTGTPHGDAQGYKTETETETETEQQQHGREAPRVVVVEEAPRPPDPRPKPATREQWATFAAEPVIRHYIATLGAIHPTGDVDSCAVRAVQWMHGPGVRLNPAWSDPSAITADLCRMLNAAAADAAFRNAHGRDLYRDPECVFGAKEGGVGRRPGVERKVPEWWSKAQPAVAARAAPAEPEKPKPEPGSLDELQAERLDWWSVSVEYGRGWDAADPPRVERLRAAGYPEPPHA